MDTIRTVDALRGRVGDWRGGGQRIALVPTMGAIHDGHLSLVRLGRARADRVVASLFVNPSQFGPNEDYTRYPADEAADSTRLAAAGCNLLYAPPVTEMYPDGFATTVAVGGLTDVLCGPHRPGHFAGVATVVAKLLIQCAPDVAVFGEKDYQQLLVIRRLVRDLDLPVEIAAGPTVREPDGLALSSRNAYLSAEERRIAPRLFAVLTDLAQELARGGVAAERCEAARVALLAAGFTAVDYVELRDGVTLALLDSAVAGARVFAAARLGATRLIDNVAVP